MACAVGKLRTLKEWRGVHGKPFKVDSRTSLVYGISVWSIQWDKNALTTDVQHSMGHICYHHVNVRTVYTFG